MSDLFVHAKDACISQVETLQKRQTSHKAEQTTIFGTNIAFIERKYVL